MEQTAGLSGALGPAELVEGSGRGYAGTTGSAFTSCDWLPTSQKEAREDGSGFLHPSGFTDLRGEVQSISGGHRRTNLVHLVVDSEANSCGRFWR